MKTYSNFSEICDGILCKYILAIVVLLLAAIIVLYVLAQLFVCLKCCFFCCYNPDLFNFVSQDMDNTTDTSDVLGTNYQPPPRKSKRVSEIDSSKRASDVILEEENEENKNMENKKLESVHLGTAGVTVINSLQGVAVEV